MVVLKCDKLIMLKYDSEVVCAFDSIVKQIYILFKGSSSRKSGPDEEKTLLLSFIILSFIIILLLNHVPGSIFLPCDSEIRSRQYVKCITKWEKDKTWQD